MRQRSRKAMSLFRGASLAAGVTMTACGAFDEDRPRPCPEIVALKDAAQLVRYRPGEGRDLIDVVEQAKFTGIEHKCEYKDGRVVVDLNISILIERGPAATSTTVDVPYFIAIVDMSEQILAKEVFRNPVIFPEDRRRIGIREETEQIIPLRGSESGASYDILIGFQLSEQELEDNRRRAR